MMRLLTTTEQRWLDEFIREKFGLGDAGVGVSDEMRMAVFGTFEFQKYLLGKNWNRLVEEILTLMRRILRF